MATRQFGDTSSRDSELAVGAFEVGIVGGRHSGKTTFICALDVAAQNTGHHNVVRRGWSVDYRNYLNDFRLKRILPPATDVPTQLSLILSGPRLAPDNWRDKIGRLRGDPVVSFGVTCTDAPGEWRKVQPESGTKAKIAREWSKVSNSAGIVFLYDPLGAREYSNTEILVELVDRLHDRGRDLEKLPLAVCIGKFDHYQVVKSLGIDRFTGKAGRVEDRFDWWPSESATAALAQLARQAGEDDFLARLQVFRTRKVFCTSAVGFFVDADRSGQPSSETHAFSRNDFYNINEDLPASMVRGAPGRTVSVVRGAIQPVNVLEPFFWLYDRHLELAPALERI